MVAETSNSGNRPRVYYKYFQEIPTRWMDNDVYGHVNNVTYYSFFDTAVNQFMLEQGVLDFKDGDTVCLVVETGCRYMQAVAFPDVLEVGMAISKLGNSSIRYELGLFKKGGDTAVAAGHFVHVNVDSKTHRPRPLPAALRTVLNGLTVGSEDGF